MTTFQSLTFETVPDRNVPAPKVPEPLVYALWWFIENVPEDAPDRNDRFFALRERVRNYAMKCGR